jgi:hypothetical protein
MPRVKSEPSPSLRVFASGATRDSDAEKLDYEGFLSPLVLKRYGEYMHSHRKQADGSLRASDNWQQGIPRQQYLKSMHRHFMDVWLHMRGYAKAATEPDLQTALCALLFNVMGLLHEVLMERGTANGNVEAHRCDACSY